jgi:hypothetical protein
MEQDVGFLRSTWRSGYIGLECTFSVGKMLVANIE